MKTCFIPYDARELGRYRETLCQRFMLASTHVLNPTCPVCASALAAERADIRTGEDVFGSYLETRGGVR